MSINADDIRAAVQSGMINERQAASLTALADLRRGARENMDGLDEPFEQLRPGDFYGSGLRFLRKNCLKW